MPRKKKPAIERFLLMCKRPKKGCWEWVGISNPKKFSGFGYGKIQVGNRTVSAHKFSYEHFVGEVPLGMCVCHRCDNPKCVNPAHLFVGTHKDNEQDKKSKGRGLTGEKHHRAILTDEQVKYIRSVYIPWSRKYGSSALARELGVDLSTVALAANGKTWKHLPRRG